MAQSSWPQFNTSFSATFPVQGSLNNYYLLTDVVNPSQQSPKSDTEVKYDEEQTVPTDSPFLRQLLEIAGPRKLHRFEKIPWADVTRKKPPLPAKRSEESLDGRGEVKGVLTSREIAQEIGYLEKCPDVLKYAYAKCRLHSKELFDVNILYKYNFINYLDLSDNRLEDVRVLSHLPFLEYLDVSQNKLDRLFGFKAPFFLSYVNYSGNHIKVIPDLSDFWSITSLILSHNQIRKIEGLHGLKHLSNLDLAYNYITKIENLKDNTRLQYLHINENEIVEFEEGALDRMFHIITIDLSHNRLTSLNIFERVENIENLSMANNRITNMLEIYYLAGKRYLRRLDFIGNPICQHQFYKSACVNLIKALKELDGEELTPENTFNCRPECDKDTLNVRKTRMQLLVLEHLSLPKISDYLIPCDQPPPNVVVFVGVPASGRKTLMKAFASLHEKIEIGVIYTTRVKRRMEIDGIDHCFISNEKFTEMLADGEFVAVSEFNGDYYGIVRTEFDKGFDGTMLVFYADLNMAMTLRLSGYQPKLVLTLPRKEETHINWLTSTYLPVQVEGYANTVRFQHKYEILNSTTEDGNETLSQTIILADAKGDVNSQQATPELPERPSSKKTSREIQAALQELISPKQVTETGVVDEEVTDGEEYTSAEDATVEFTIEEEEDDDDGEEDGVTGSEITTEAAIPEFIEEEEFTSSNVTSEGFSEVIEEEEEEFTEATVSNEEIIEKEAKDSEITMTEFTDAEIAEIVRTGTPKFTTSQVKKSEVTKTEETQGEGTTAGKATVVQVAPAGVTEAEATTIEVMKTEKKEKEVTTVEAEIAKVTRGEVSKGEVPKPGIVKLETSIPKGRMPGGDNSMKVLKLEDIREESSKKVVLFEDSTTSRTSLRISSSNATKKIVDASVSTIDEDDDDDEVVVDNSKKSAIFEESTSGNIEDVGPDEYTKTFVELVLSKRRELLEIHWENPGFFRTLIFTDDNEDVVNSKLNDMLKCYRKCYRHVKPLFGQVKDESRDSIIKDKLSFLKIADHLFLYDTKDM